MFPYKVLGFVMSVAILSVSVTSVVMAQANSKAVNNTSTASEQSPEMKKNLADMYQKMADCMKTDKSQHDCHKEIIKDCPVAKATGSCPLMNGMEGMKNQGKMKHGKMKDMKGMKDAKMDHMDHDEAKP